MIPYFMSFDLPKQIVNGPIQGKGFDDPNATQLFMHIAFNIPGLGQVTLTSAYKIMMTQLSRLLLKLAVWLLLLLVLSPFLMPM